ncbi:chloride channel protein [soil metagenome]
MFVALIDGAVRFRLFITRTLVRLGFREDSFFLLLAVLVGIVTAGAAVLFHELIVRLREVLFAAPGEKRLYGSGLYLLVLIPTLGGLVVGVLSKLVFKVKGIHGLADVMESVIRSKGFIRPTVAVEKILTSGITIGTGGSVGAEAPIVQIGAAIASAFGRLFGLSRQYMPLVIGCGSAAGISAIFNSPICGVLFTLEVILQDFSIRTFAPVVVASVIANVTTKAILQSTLGVHYEAIFALPDNLISMQMDAGMMQMANFVLLGIGCGLVAVFFTKVMIRLEHQFNHLKIPAFLKPSLGGLLVGLMGVAYVLVFGRLLLNQSKPIPFGTYPMPAFFSDGYGAMQPMLSAAFYSHGGWSTSYLLAFLATLLLLKIAAACITVSSGGGGGVIGPALFLGAVLGGLLGVVSRLLGGSTVQPEIYALVGMGAVLAAVVHAPMASILILLELTHDYKITLPAMLATVTAVGIARLIYRDSIYTSILRERGVHMGESSDLLLLRRLSVEQLTLEPAINVHPDDALQSIFHQIEDNGVADFVVIDAKGNYAGMLVAEDALNALRHPEASPLLIVADLVRPNIPMLRNTDDLAMAFDRFAAFDVEHLPVTTDQAANHVIGMLSRKSVIRKYREGSTATT